MFTSLQARLKRAGKWLPLMLLPFAVSAQAPANDNCSGAIALPVAAACTTTIGDNTNATASGMANPSCSPGGTSTKGVWYSVVVPAGGGVTVTTSAVAGSPVDDTIVEIFSGSCGSLTLLTCSEDISPTNYFSSAEVAGQTVGARLYVRLTSYNDANLGQFGICATLPASGTANDNPSGAIALGLTATCTPTSATNVGATTTPANGYTNPGCAVAVNPKDVWFSFTTLASGQQGSTAATITVSGTPAGQVRVFSSTNGAAGPFTQVGCSAGTAVNTEAAPLSVRGLTSNTTYYVSVSGFGSNDVQGAFTICATVLNLPLNDAGVVAIYTLTKLPSPQGTPHVVRARITNAGFNAQTNLPVTLTVTGANSFTSTQTLASLASGASVIVSFAGFSPTVGGTNTLTVTVPSDNANANNSQTATQLVNATDYSYADASAPNSARGFAPTGATSAFLARYSTTTSIEVTQVRAFLVDFIPTPTATQDPTTGKTVYGIIMNATTGAVLGRSPDFVVTTASLNTYTPFTFNTPVTVPAGDFLVGLVQTYQTGQTRQYFPIGTQPDVIGRTDAFYTSPVGTPALTDIGSTQIRLMLEAVTRPANGVPICSPVTGLTVNNITATSASVAFTGTPGATYTVTYQAVGGTVQTVTTNPTASPVLLTGLTANTSYTVTVTTNCTGGTTSLGTSATFRTQQTPPASAVLPYAEDFEGPWINGLATRDIPSAPWRNTPATGDNSWRREDDGFASAGWRFAADETGTTPPYAIRSSTGAHSARFHTFGSDAGTMGRFDLYVNMSTPGNKRLSFDYINPSGTDRLDVLVSTDGGATFSATPVLTATTSATFSGRIATISSTSATTLIRFQATSDFGADDIGIDNLRIATVSSTRNEALAATVSLFPNPAHQSFQLTVPAGSLHAAKASLLNALGQVVQQRQLNLPVAGGTADFNVSGLAAGVYSLQLKTSNDLVVKRVVVE